MVNPGSQGRDGELAPEVEAEIMWWITAQSDKRQYLGQTKILYHARDVYGLPITKESVNFCGKRYQKSFCTGKWFLQEDSWLQIPR
jgi:hypothetical protein